MELDIKTTKSYKQTQGIILPALGVVLLLRVLVESLRNHWLWTSVFSNPHLLPVRKERLPGLLGAAVRWNALALGIRAESHLEQPGLPSPHDAWLQPIEE